jgi:enoyl-CoA hydratase/carnithine racemase
MPISVDYPDRGIARVLLQNVERRNAFTLEMVESLAATWPNLATDPAIRVVIVTGAGEEAFSSGADLSVDMASVPHIDLLIDAALLKTKFFPKPLIAAINGVCVAGGLELALSADIRIACENARLGLPEVCWGIMPSGGAAMKLADQIGHANAMDLLLSGRLISGHDAERIGLVSSVLPVEGFADAVLAYARVIARNSPVAVSAAKAAAMLHRSNDYQGREEAERKLVSSVRASGHYKIGIEAFLAKARPSFPDT